MGVHLNVHVVASDDCLTPNWANLNLHVDNLERLCADVDLYKARVDRLVELAETGHKSDRAWMKTSR